MKLNEILDGNRKNKMFSCIYLWTNEINGKHYVGQTQHFYNRMNDYKNGKATPYLNSAMRKYGMENFSVEIIEYCPIELLDEREQYWMDYYKSYERSNGYNICQYASTTRGYRHTEQAKQKMSERAKNRMYNLDGENNPMYGKHLSDEHKEAISQHLKERWRDEYYRKAQSERMSGENNYFYNKHLTKELNPMYGKHHTDDTKKKISEKNKGNHTIGGCIKVKCIETGEIFISMSEVARRLNTHTSAVKIAVDNPNRTCRGFHFEKI